MQPRYFIGITLPEPLSIAISKVQNELFTPGKVMPPLTPHITLLPPNSLETLSPIYFIPKVQQLAKEHLTFNVQLTKTALYDERVLHITVESPGVMALQRAMVDLLPDKVQAQYMVGRDFTPHVTLAQAKPKQKLSAELIAEFRSRIDPLLPQIFTVPNLTQFTWVKPRTYQVEKI